MGWGLRYLFFLILIFYSFNVSVFAQTPCSKSLHELIAEEDDPDDDRIRVAAIVVAEKDGGLLFGYRVGANANERLTWGFAGGSMESFDPDLLAAAKREFQEETGLDIDRDRFRYLKKVRYVGTDSRLYICHFYFLRLRLDENPAIPDKEIDRLRSWMFFPLGRLPDPMFSTNQELIDWIQVHRADILSEP